jgi:hypothetical protein
LALGVRGDGADLAHRFAEFAVVEFLAAGGVHDLDQAADLVGAVAGFLDSWMLKSEVVFILGAIPAQQRQKARPDPHVVLEEGKRKNPLSTSGRVRCSRLTTAG